MTGDSRTKIYENRCDAVNDFIQRKQAMGRSERTLNSYSRVLREVFHDVHPDKQPGDLTVRDMEDYVAELAARDCSQNTKRRYLESLSAFYSWAMKRPRFDTIAGNPAAVVLEELPKQRRDRPDCATWANAKRIVHSIGDPRDKMIATFMAKSGCRVSEVLGIEVDDLLLDDGYVRVRNRKGGGTTVMPIDDETRQAFDKYLLLRNDRGSDTDAVFVSTRGTPVTRTRVQRAVRRAAVDADVMDEGEDRFHKKFTPHTFRTVFTTVMRNQGMPDHILRYLRGDADNDEMDLYTRVDRTAAKEKYLDYVRSLGL